MSELFTSGRIVDVVIAFMAVEACVLFVAGRWLSRRLGSLDVVLILMPGLFLLLAMRAAITGADWSIIAIWLVAALVAHLADLGRRLSR